MAVITQYLIKNGAVQSGYTFTATTSTTGTIEGVNISFTRRGFDSNSVSNNYRRLRENVTSYANREAAYYLNANISFSGWSKLRCTFYATHNATDGTGRYCRVYIYKNTATYLDSGTKGTNYQYVQAGTSSSTKDISLTSTLISNCNRISICVATSYADVSGYIKDLWLERDAATYTVSYNANGHGTAPASQTKTEGTALTLRSFIGNVTTGGVDTTVTITGNANGNTWSGSNGNAHYNTLQHVYSQTYWNTNSSGTGTNYSSGGSYTANAAATLYAIWKDTQTPATGTSYTLPTGTPSKASTQSNSYTVAYNANGGTSTPSTQTSKITTTYKFDGWYTAATGGTKRTTSSRVTAAETVYAHCVTDTTTQGSVTLASTISKNNTTEDGYVVTFNANNGSTTKSSETATRTIAWAFDKWALNSATGTQYNAGASFTPSANSTMYATWTSSVYSEGSVTLPTAAQCTRSGYTLLGFSTSDTATSADYAPGATYNPTAAIILYAVWQIAQTVFVKVRIGSVWKDATPYVYINGAWVSAKANLRIGTAWKD